MSRTNFKKLAQARKASRESNTNTCNICKLEATCITERYCHMCFIQKTGEFPKYVYVNKLKSESQ